MNDEWCCCCFLQQFYENPTQNTRHLFTVNDMHRKFKSSQKRACCSKFPLQMVDNGPKHIAHKLNHSPNALEIQSVYLCREFDMNNNARSELAFPHVPNDSEWWISVPRNNQSGNKCKFLSSRPRAWTCDWCISPYLCLDFKVALSICHIYTFEHELNIRTEKFVGQLFVHFIK